MNNSLKVLLATTAPAFLIAAALPAPADAPATNPTTQPATQPGTQPETQPGDPSQTWQGGTILVAGIRR